MAGQERNIEGDSEQRRRAAREAKRGGKRPSEVRSTLGASKQRKETERRASHQERMDVKVEGKRGAGTGGGGPLTGCRAPRTGHQAPGTPVGGSAIGVPPRP